MLTTAEAAAALGVTRRQVLKLISQEKIKATRFGIAWQVDEESVKEYQQIERKPGWVRGRKRSKSKVNKQNFAQDIAHNDDLRDGAEGDTTD